MTGEPASSRLRIVHVVNNLAIGGAERVAVNLAVAQVDAGHETEIYCIDGRGPLAAVAEGGGVKVTDFAKGRGLSARTVAAIRRSIRAEKADVVHTHNPSAHYYGAVAAWLGGAAAIVNTRHSPVSSEGARYRERYYRWLLPLTGAVVFVSENARAAVVGNWGTKQPLTDVIANGIPVHEFSSRPARPGSRMPRLVFGTLGRLAPIKAHEVLIRAFRAVHDAAAGAELRIVGGGPLESALKAQVAEMGLANCVSIEPPTSEPAEVLSALDVFVISSLSEGLPMVLLEAMAAGLPIVSTRVGGIPEVVPEGRAGWFCQAGDADALAVAMLEAQKSCDLAQRGRAAADLAAARYDVKHMAASYENLYRAVLAGNGKAMAAVQRDH